MGNECSRLEPVTLQYLRQSTEFSTEEITEWHKIFLRDCPSGQLSLDEFKIMFQNFFPNGDSSMFAEHVFRAYDINCDGLIDFVEFLTALSITSRGKLDQKLRWIFGMYDIDRNGYITPEEMLKIVTSLHNIASFIAMPEDESTPLKRTAKLFRLLDRNMDGRIYLDEFIEGAMSHPHICKLLLHDPLNFQGNS